MIDARGQSCPLPVVMTQRAVQKDRPAKLEVLVDAQVAVENISRYAHTQGYHVETAREGPDFRLTLTRET